MDDQTRVNMNLNREPRVHRRLRSERYAHSETVEGTDAAETGRTEMPEKNPETEGQEIASESADNSTLIRKSPAEAASDDRLYRKSAADQDRGDNRFRRPVEEIPADDSMRFRRKTGSTIQAEQDEAEKPEQKQETTAARMPQPSVNPLQDLANRPASVSAGGASRMRAMNRVAPAARRQIPATRSTVHPAGKEKAEEQTLRIGYAPGRMEENEQARSRQTDAGAERTGSASGMRSTGKLIPVREYPGNRYQTTPTKTGGTSSEPRTGLRTVLIIVAAVALIAGAVLLAVHFISGKGDGGSDTTVSPEPNSVYAFTVSGNENQTAPADITFSATTSKQVTEVRLTDEDGVPVATQVAHGDNAADNVWILTLHTDAGYDGTVILQIRSGEEEWRNTDCSAMVQVAAQGAPPVSTDAPTGTEVGVILEQAQTAEASAEEPETSPEDDGENALPAEKTFAEAPVEEWTEKVLLPEEGVPEGEMLPEEGLIEEEMLPEDNTLQESLAADEAVPEENLPDDAMKEEEESLPEEPQAEATPSPTEVPTPDPTATPALTALAAEEADPALISASTVYSGSKKQKNYTRAAKELIRMPAGSAYSKKNMGVLTFRSDAFRQNAAAGLVKNAEKMEQAWQTEAGSARGASTTYYGIGWTGQPAIVKWSKEVREMSNLYENKIEKTGLKEVIIAGMDGVIYFLDLDDGSLTRNSIKLGYPMKGTPSVHPSGYPYMTVGQYARKMKSRTGKIGLRQYNLYTQKEMTLIDGLDGKLHRGYNDMGSFETSALIDRTSDTLITAGTNGLLYLVSLNSDFDYQAGTYRQSGASTVVLKSKAKTEKKDAWTAVESSVAMYDKYVFYADMGGVLRCVDTDTLQAVWAAGTGDAVEATVALNMKEDKLDLYTANMLINRSKGSAQIRCYDALSGAEKWLTEIPVKKDTKTKKEAGVKASPLVGQNQLGDIVYFTVTGLSEAGAEELGLAADTQAALVALRQQDGKTVWTSALPDRSESSPVAVYDENGRGWVIQAAENGEILLLDGLTGQEIHRLTVEGEITGSPAVYNDMMVIGTTGKNTSYIYGIRIR